MEDVYTVKVKTKPDTRNVYPSERRYSASTVSGLAWVHIALAATSFLLACLALVNPNSDIKRLTLNDTNEVKINGSELVFNLTDNNEDGFEKVDSNIDANVTLAENNNATETVNKDSNYILVLAPTLLTIFALAAGIASIMASVRWYVDRNITWLFIASILSTLFAFASFVMVLTWFVKTSDGDDITDFYKDNVPFKDYFVVKRENIVHTNDTHIIIKNSSTTEDETSQVFTKRVLSINILIASFLEFLWSLLSLKISFKGMRNTYSNSDIENRGNCISVVTKIKGNNTKLPRKRNPEIGNKIKRIFLAQNDNGFYLKTQNNKAKQNTETSSEFYKERMMNFLNRCASFDGVSNPEQIEHMPAVNDNETTLNPIPEATQIEINIHTTPDPVVEEDRPIEVDRDRMTPISWGDTPDHTIYNQNTLNLEKIFKFAAKMEEDDKEKNKKKKDAV